MTLSCSIAITIALVSVASAADYEKDIKPLLKERCIACHGTVKQKGGLRLDAGSLVLKGGKHPVVKPGHSDTSPLLQRVLSTDADEQMPPEGARLTAAQIEALRQWIDSGAKVSPNEPVPKSPSEHWAFQPVKRPPIPQSSHTNPIDAFIFGQADAPPAATPRALLRRLHLDLTGLPPSPAEQD